MFVKNVESSKAKDKSANLTIGFIVKCLFQGQLLNSEKGLITYAHMVQYI